MNEFIGFLISLIAFVYLMWKWRSEERAKNKNPEEYDRKKKQQEENLRLFLKSLDIEMEKPVPPPPPKKKKPAAPKVAPKEIPKEIPYESHFEKYEFKSALDERYKEVTHLQAAPKYEVHQRRSNSRVEKMIKALPSLKQMIIMQTVIGKPKGLE